MRKILIYILLSLPLVVLVWLLQVVITLPLLGVFLIEDVFSTPEYLQVLLVFLGRAVAIVIVVCWPLAYLLEKLAINAFKSSWKRFKPRRESKR